MKIEKIMTNFSFKKSSYWAIFSFAAKCIIKSPLNVFLGLFLNIIIMVSWLAFKQNDSFLLTSIIGTAILRNGLYTFLRSMLNNRRTGFTNRLKATSISPWKIAAGFTSWNLVWNIFVSFVLIAIAMAFFPDQRVLWADVNWGMWLSGCFLLWIGSVSFAYAHYIIWQDNDIAQMVSIIVYVIAFTFFGCAFPYATISQLKWLNDVLYLFPQRYALNIMQAGWVGATNLYFSNGIESVDWQLGRQLWVPYFITILYIGALCGFISGRAYLINKHLKKDLAEASVILKTNREYIKAIKRASTISELEKIKNDRNNALKK